MIDDYTTIFRLVTATILSGAIGFERQYKGKIAGLKTHILVGLGSCLVAIMSVNMYMSVQGFTNADPARLAAQVVSGIGFLGAGTILKEGPTIRGLTTAASLWVVAAVGLASGAGYYTGALATTGIVIMVLVFLPRLEYLVNQGPLLVNLTIQSLDVPGQIGRIGSYLGSHGVSISDIHIEEMQKGQIYIPVTLKLPKKELLPQIVGDLAKIEGVLAVSED